MDAEKLIVFVKAPQPGAVKTRLARAIGADAACGAYRRLVEQLLGQLSRLQGVELRFSPDEAAAQIRPWLRESWQMRAQGSGDLGERLQRAFADAFGEGAQRVVVIGSDCPTVSPPDIGAAWSALRSRDVVLGPATDGGYWLIGLGAPQPSLFTGIPWSTNAVLARTLHRATAAGLRAQLLREMADVDTPADWRAFVAGAPVV